MYNITTTNLAISAIVLRLSLQASRRWEPKLLLHSPTAARTKTAAGVRHAATLNYVLLSSESHGATLNSAQTAWSNAELCPNRTEQRCTSSVL